MDDETPDSGVRLQKVLAAAGFGSRRECEELISEGRVEVDGKVADELGVRVDLDRQKVHVDGTLVKTPRKRYYLLNKPKGVLCTSRDPAGRTRAIDLVPEEARVFTVGRLDMESEGLLLLTNDGELANRLTHPRYGVPKTYLVAVQGQPDEATLNKLRDGVPLSEGIARVASFKVRRKSSTNTELEITLQEGKNREVRRIFAKLGHKVLRLRRISLGPLRLGELPTGAHRELKSEELEKLKEVAGTIPRRRPKKSSGGNSRQILESGKRKARERSEPGEERGARPPRAAPGRPGASRPGAARPGAFRKKTSDRPGAGRPGSAARPGGERRPTASGRPGAASGSPAPQRGPAGRKKAVGRKPAGDVKPVGREGRVLGYDAPDRGAGPKKRPFKKAAGGSRPPAAGAPGKRPAKKTPPRAGAPKKIPLSQRLRRNDDDD